MIGPAGMVVVTFAGIEVTVPLTDEVVVASCAAGSPVVVSVNIIASLIAFQFGGLVVVRHVELSDEQPDGGDQPMRYVAETNPLPTVESAAAAVLKLLAVAEPDVLVAVTSALNE